MKVVAPTFQEISYDSPYKMIERAGRVCYKSENYIKEGSDVLFTKKILSFNHGSVLEHAYLVFEVLDRNLFSKMRSFSLKFLTFTESEKCLLSGNFRALYELYFSFEEESFYPFFAYLENLFPDIFPQKYQKYLRKDLFRKLEKSEICSLREEEKEVHLSITILFLTDRGVSHELVRHRLASYAQESTRYCNYSKDKFAHEISFVRPLNLTKEQEILWEEAMKNAEKSYFSLIESGAKAEQARSVLPNS